MKIVIGVLCSNEYVHEDILDMVATDEGDNTSTLFTCPECNRVSIVTMVKG